MSTDIAHVFNPFAAHLALQVESAADGRCRSTLQVAPYHLNPHGVVHGAVLFALADTSMGHALYTRLAPGQSCTTIELKINFLAAGRTNRIVCDSEVLRVGRTVAHLESRLYAAEQLLATVSGHFAILAPRG